MNTLVAREPTDVTRIELAMLELMPASLDPDKARTVLRPILEEGSQGDLRNLASFLYDYADSVKDTMKKLHDEQKRSSVLEGKLDALKNLEIHLMEPNR